MWCTARKTLLSIFLILGSQCELVAQHFPVVHYSSGQGLPDANIFDLAIGPRGRLWIASERGLSSFNGLRFHAFEAPASEQHLRGVIRIARDEKEQLWAGTHKHGIFVVDHENARHSNIDLVTLKALLPMGDKLLVHGFSIQLVDTATQEVQTIKADGNRVVIAPLDRSRCLWIEPHALSYVHADGKRELQCTSNPREPLHSGVIHEDTVWLGSKGKILEWTGDQLRTHAVFSPSLTVTRLMRDQSGSFWFCDNETGLYVWKDARLIDLGRQFGLERTRVSRILEDANGNIWVATLGQGLYRFHHTYLTHFDRTSGYDGGTVFDIDFQDCGRYLLGTYNDLYRFDSLGLYPLGLSCYYIRDVQVVHPKKVLLAAHPRRGELPHHLSEGNTMFYPMLSYAQATTPAGRIFYSYYANLIHSIGGGNKEGGLKDFSFGTELVHRTNQLVCLGGTLWQATTGGLRITDTLGRSLHSWKTRSERSSSHLDQALAGEVHTLYPISDSIVWAVTESHVVSITARGNSFRLDSVCCTGLRGMQCLVQDDRHRLWVGTSNGVYVYEDGQAVFHFSHQSGLISNQVTSLRFDPGRKRMLIGTTEGLSVLNLRAWEAHREPTPSITLASIASGEGELPGDEQGGFTIGDRDFLRVVVEASNMGEVSPVSFRYLMDGSEVGFTTENKLVLGSLSEGHHELLVMARTENSDWSLPLPVRFRVVQPWYRSQGFRWGMALLAVLSGLLALLWWQRRKHRERMREVEVVAEIDRLKQQGLLAMMRPHFTSNVVAAVRHSLRQNDNLAVDIAMSRLSRLMRMNLHMVQRPLISLQEEINWLTNYAELERFAREADWPFQLEVDPDLNPEHWGIPPMLVQPVLENAIIHGMQVENPWLQISFRASGGDCLIEVTDHGPGFQPDDGSPSSDHVSHGMRILSERLDMLSRLTGRSHRMETIMGRDTGADFGTRVCIRLPLSAVASPPPENMHTARP